MLRKIDQSNLLLDKLVELLHITDNWSKKNNTPEIVIWWEYHIPTILLSQGYMEGETGHSEEQYHNGNLKSYCAQQLYLRESHIRGESFLEEELRGRNLTE